MEKTELRPHAHPMPGWIAIMPVDTEDMDDGVKRFHARNENFLLEILTPSVGIAVGIVLEVGTLPSHVDQDEIIPYPEKSTIYYPDGNGFDIGDYHYVQVQSVVAWDDPPPDA